MAFDQYQKGPNTFLMIIYLIFGLYFVNFPFQFVKIPESFMGIEKWIIFVGGLLILLGAVNYFRVKRRVY